jgi:OOP family OmpA-OmpF porin
MMDEVAAIMLKNKDISFSVSGYTDDRGKDGYNLRLSEKRANEARLYLIARGVESDRITAKGYGEANPRFDNNTKQGRQLNRRVEIKSVGVYERKTRVILEKKN